MTAPIVIQRKGTGQAAQQAAAPFLSALQDRRAKEIQQAQFAQRQELLERQLEQQSQSQERSQAATFLMAAINQGVAPTDPIIQQFEQTIGAPGFAAAVTGAQKKSKSQQERDFETFLEESSFSDAAKQGLRADRSLAALPKPPTAEVRNQIFQQIAPGEQTALQTAELENLRARTRKLQRELERAEVPTIEQQQKAAAAQGITGDAFLPFIDYATILETRLKQKESDPGPLVIRTSLDLIAKTTDLLGQPTSLPQEAVSVALGVIKGIVPGTEDIQLTPEDMTVLNSMESATRLVLQWAELKPRERRTFPIGDTGTVVDLRDEARLRSFLQTQLEQIIPEGQRSQIPEMIRLALRHGIRL